MIFKERVIYMNKNIESYIDEYEVIQRQIDNYEKQINNLRTLLNQKVEVLEEQIAYFKRKFEREISPLNDKIDECQQELNKFSLNHKTKIRVGDIINEISCITGVDINDIEISGGRSYVSYPTLESIDKPWTKQHIFEYVATHTDPVNVFIHIDYKNQDIPFFYRLTFECNLSDKESNGKMLLEHKIKRRPMIIQRFEKNGKGEILGHTPMPLDDEGLEDIFCSFNLKQIIDFKNNYKNDILSRAVINCLNKQKTQEKGKRKNLHI